MSDEDRDRRPAAETWSVNEYADHMRETFFGLRALAAIALESPGSGLGPSIEPGPAGPHRTIDVEPVNLAFKVEATEFAKLLSETPATNWQANVILGGKPRSTRWVCGIDGDSTRILHDRHPGWSRWYASVITTGTVAPGDPVTMSG